MPYPLRIYDADAVYHVWTRATEGLWLTRDDEDRWRFMRLLKLTCGRYNLRCHMYCVLGTHYHLVLTAPAGNLAAAMQWLNGVYVLTFNRRHGRRGHLVSERYSAKMVDTEEYALNICRYVPLNPVAAGLCERPEQWPWSSYAATIGRAIKPSFLHDDLVLRLFADDHAEARAAFREHVEAGVEFVVEVPIAAAAG